jgi:hypothetical protein
LNYTFHIYNYYLIVNLFIFCFCLYVSVGQIINCFCSPSDVEVLPCNTLDYHPNVVCLSSVSCVPGVSFSQNGRQPGCKPCTTCPLGTISDGNCTIYSDAVCITNAPTSAPVAISSTDSRDGIFPNMGIQQSVGLVVGGIILLMLVFGFVLAIKFCCCEKDTPMYSNARPTQKLHPQTSLQPQVHSSSRLEVAYSEQNSVEMTPFISVQQPPEPESVSMSYPTSPLQSESASGYDNVQMHNYSQDRPAHDPNGQRLPFTNEDQVKTSFNIQFSFLESEM